ncbi:MAG: sigma-54 interaction domain-containing protein [Syntrophaceticus sp.]|jgi:PAS domain S-box-containing protein
MCEENSEKLKDCLDKQTYEKILENCYDEVFVLDSKDRVIYVNGAGERHYGMKASEVIGKTIYELNNQGYWYPTINPYVRQEKRRVTLEQKTFLGKLLLTTTTPVLNENGDIELIIYNSRDVTQLEAMKQELERMRAKHSGSNKNDKGYHCDIITHNKKMKELINYAEQVAVVDSNILIMGESGTGKGLLAKHIHNNSLRKDGPFITISCAAIPEELLESELFGYSHGAFTGANKTGKKGLIEVANKGTLFLDEIGELSPRLQAKLLHFIQDLKYIPVGGTKVKTADVRVLSATNRNLLEMTKTGEFREDLYYRLNVIEINIPPLRERPEDIKALVPYFVGKFSNKYHISREISGECMDIFYHYNWPGNVRELENYIERLVVSVREYEIKPHHLKRLHNKSITDPTSMSASMDDLFNSNKLPSKFSFDSIIQRVEEELVNKAVEKHGSSRKVAKAMGISHSKAARLIRKYC